MLLETDPEIEIVGEAENGKEAIKLALTRAPDLILMDLQMPIMGGLEATERISQWSSKIKVVIITAAWSRTDCVSELKAKECGAVRVLPKPCMSWSDKGTRDFIKVLKILAAEPRG
jgi:CheY-like chemotaxis protein